MPRWAKHIKSNPNVCLDCDGEEACDTCAWVWFIQAWKERRDCDVPAFYWWAATRYGATRVAISVMRAGWHDCVRGFRVKRKALRETTFK